MDVKTVLIIDDHALNREVFAILLESHGYSVLHAENGQEGIRMARECRPDLILMDIAMPVMDGIEATEMLKLDATTREIPVIGVSAFDDPLTISRAYAVGMLAYLTKPANPRRLLMEVERKLENSSTGPALDTKVLPFRSR